MLYGSPILTFLPSICRIKDNLPHLSSRGPVKLLSSQVVSVYFSFLTFLVHFWLFLILPDEDRNKLDDSVVAHVYRFLLLTVVSPSVSGRVI